MSASASRRSLYLLGIRPWRKSSTLDPMASSFWQKATVRLGLAAAMTVTSCSLEAKADEQSRPQKRCGWVSNPTPGNWDLVDRDGTWEIGNQGDEGATGGLPEDRPSGRRWWVETRSGGYGYGCMCLNVRVDKAEMRILEIVSGRSLTLQQCRKDKAIKGSEPRP